MAADVMFLNGLAFVVSALKNEVRDGIACTKVTREDTVNNNNNNR